MTVGETLTGVPLVAGRLPGVIMPVPLAKIPVRLLEPPDEMDAGLATKLVIVGATGTTGSAVTVVACWVVAPAAFVTVRI